MKLFHYFVMNPYLGLGIFHVMLLCERVYSIHRSSDIKNWAGYSFMMAAVRINFLKLLNESVLVDCSYSGYSLHVSQRKSGRRI